MLLWYLFKLILRKQYHYCVSKDFVFSGVWSTRRKQGFSRDTDYVQQEGNI